MVFPPHLLFLPPLMAGEAEALQKKYNKNTAAKRELRLIFLLLPLINPPINGKISQFFGEERKC